MGKKLLTIDQWKTGIWLCLFAIGVILFIATYLRFGLVVDKSNASVLAIILCLIIIIFERTDSINQRLLKLEKMEKVI